MSNYQYYGDSEYGAMNPDMSSWPTSSYPVSNDLAQGSTYHEDPRLVFAKSAASANIRYIRALEALQTVAAHGASVEELRSDLDSAGIAWVQALNDFNDLQGRCDATARASEGIQDLGSPGSPETVNQYLHDEASTTEDSFRVSEYGLAASRYFRNRYGTETYEIVFKGPRSGQPLDIQELRVSACDSEDRKKHRLLSEHFDRALPFYVECGRPS